MLVRKKDYGNRHQNIKIELLPFLLFFSKMASVMHHLSWISIPQCFGQNYNQRGFFVTCLLVMPYWLVLMFWNFRPNRWISGFQRRSWMQIWSVFPNEDQPEAYGNISLLRLIFMSHNPKNSNLWDGPKAEKKITGSRQLWRDSHPSIASNIIFF